MRRGGRSPPPPAAYGKAAANAASAAEQKGARPDPTVHTKQKRTAKADRARYTCCFGFGSGESPGTAYLVSDLSRLCGLHSDRLAGHLTPFRRQSSKKTGTPSCIYLSGDSITQRMVNCKGSCLYFPQKRDAPPQRDASPCIEGPLQALLVGLDHLLDHLAADGTGLAAGKVAVVAVLQVDAHLSRCVFTSKI